MTITDLEKYREQMLGKPKSEGLTIMLSAEEQDYLFNLIEPKAISLQKNIAHLQSQGVQTTKARNRLLIDIDRCMMLIKLTNKLKGE
jgi:hypothetical protein